MSALVWGNPLAWIGALAVGVPILVHLLATRRARRLAFPTLRFLPAVAPTAMRARRVEDAALLALRCLVVLAAVAALAQPWLAIEGRTGPGAGDLPLAVVVDNGASMTRPATGAAGLGAALGGQAGGGLDAEPGRESGGRAPAGQTGGGFVAGAPALDVARAMAARLTEGRAPTTVIESADLAAGIAAARTWLAQDGARSFAGGGGEIAVLSDFQRGSLDRRDLEAVPAGTGVRLQRIAVASPEELALPALAIGEQTWSVSIVIDGEAPISRVGWRARPARSAAGSGLPPTGPDQPPTGAVPSPTGSGPLPAPELLAGDEAAADAEAAARAASRVVAVPIAAAETLVATPRGGQSETGTVTREQGDATAPDAAGSGVASAPAFAAAGLDVAVITVVWPGSPRRETLLAESPPPDRPWMAAVLAALPRDAAVQARSGGDRLYLFADGAPGSLASAELLAAVRRATATPAAALDELEPGVIDDALLRSWERVSEATPVAAGNDGRWLWLAVLGLLAAEQWWRRRVAVREGSSVDV